MQIFNCVLNILLLAMVIYDGRLTKKMIRQCQEMKAQYLEIETDNKKLMGYLQDISFEISKQSEAVQGYADHTQQTLTYDRMKNTNCFSIIVKKIKEMEQEHK